MSKSSIFAIAALAVSLTAGHAFAESEGNGNPYAFQASGQVTDGHAFVSDAGSASYPISTGNSAQNSTLAALEPAFGHEAPIQTASSLPVGSGEGTVAYGQAQRLNRHFAGQARNPGYLEAGLVRPAG